MSIIVRHLADRIHSLGQKPIYNGNFKPKLDQLEKLVHQYCAIPLDIRQANRADIGYGFGRAILLGRIHSDGGGETKLVCQQLLDFPSENLGTLRTALEAVQKRAYDFNTDMRDASNVHLVRKLKSTSEESQRQVLNTRSMQHQATPLPLPHNQFSKEMLDIMDRIFELAHTHCGWPLPHPSTRSDSGGPTSSHHSIKAAAPICHIPSHMPISIPPQSLVYPIVSYLITNNPRPSLNQPSIDQDVGLMLQSKTMFAKRSHAPPHY